MKVRARRNHRMPELNDPEIYQAILDGLQTGVYLVDRNRRIRFWNEGAEEITGYLRQDVVGRFLRDHLLSPADKEKDLESDPEDPISLAFRDGKASTMEVSILHKDGYRVPIVLRTLPIRNTRGAVVGAAESFERNRSASEWSRRHSTFADFGCLDSVTGVAAKSYMETQLREHFVTFVEHHIVVPTILRVIAQSLENTLRPTDLVGVWGQNQFIAILLQCRESEVVLVGERIRKTIGQAEIEWWGDTFSVTSPVGGAGCRPGDEVESLVARAAASLQESIGRGGNRVTVLG
jgi:PAS domain S-box-containing protein